MAGGYAAGKHAARYAAKVAQLRPLKAKELEDERRRVFAPLMRNAGTAPGEFESIVRMITTDHFGPYKSEVSLTSAIAKLDGLDQYREGQQPA